MILVGFSLTELPLVSSSSSVQMRHDALKVLCYKYTE